MSLYNIPLSYGRLRPNDNQAGRDSGPENTVAISDKNPLDSQLPKHEVSRVVCHRLSTNGGNEREEYLCRWKTTNNDEYHPFSWHSIEEIPASSLHRVQAYVNSLRETFHTGSNPLKRKSPEGDAINGQHRVKTFIDSNPSLAPTLPSPTEYSSTLASTNIDPILPDPDANEYNCILSTENGEIKLAKTFHRWKSGEFPTAAMTAKASLIFPRKAIFEIQNEFKKRLAKLSEGTGRARITVVNEIDNSSPPLNFKFISKNRPGDGVSAADDATLEGCGQRRGDRAGGGHMFCRENMGQDIGCEYSTLCECLEYAAIDEKRMTDEHYKLQAEGKRMGLPKRFPYHNPLGTKAGLLVTFYLDSRSPIYECNPKCACGPGCKTRVVQHGRKIPLEIFKTPNRGWGLRSPVAIATGQFIDTYRGEIITNKEADDREERVKRDNERTNKVKGSYLYSLDKFADELPGGDDDCYVIDGEHIGGPTRFINHSCEPNCRQYTVSYNKNDFQVYELAFFASRPIPAYEELVFDYLDKDDQVGDEGNEQTGPGDDANSMECRCGSDRCRGKLWI